ncbi:hypothetical protein VCR3J2_320376 [Vibrio coralliirubri]|nr:hypothetical protein VCR3J2_320376 [Vibrio coralliirubri]
MSVSAIARMCVKGKEESCIRLLSHQAKYRAKHQEFSIAELNNFWLTR